MHALKKRDVLKHPVQFWFNKFAPELDNFFTIIGISAILDLDYFVTRKQMRGKKEMTLREFINKIYYDDEI